MSLKSSCQRNVFISKTLRALTNTIQSKLCHKEKLISFGGHEVFDIILFDTNDLSKADGIHCLSTNFQKVAHQQVIEFYDKYTIYSAINTLYILLLPRLDAPLIKILSGHLKHLKTPSIPTLFSTRFLSN